MSTEWEAKPWMPLVIDKWRGSPTVRSMTDAERDCYLNLLMAQWEQKDGMLPDDDRQLKKLSMRRDDWDQVKAVVLDEFDLMGNGRRANVKQYMEWQRAYEIADSAAERGSAGGKKKAENRRRVANPSSATFLLDVSYDLASDQLEEPASKPLANPSQQQQQRQRQQQEQQQTGDDAGLGVLIERLACAHPKSREKCLQPIDLTPAAVAAVSQAVVSEASLLSCTMVEAAAVMLDLVVEIAKQTPPAQVRYVPNLESFFRNRDYRRRADSWSGYAAGNGGPGRTKSDRNLSELRDLINPGPAPAMDQPAACGDSNGPPGSDRQGRVPPVLEGNGGLPAGGHRSSSQGAMPNASP